MSTISRRRFLTNGIGLVAIGSATAVGARFALTDVEDVVERIVLHYLGSDGVAPGAARDFAADYAEVTTLGWKFRSAMAAELYFLPGFRSNLPAGNKRNIERYDRRVITDFLLSSDYEEGSGTDVVLNYIGYDEYRVCNPFARQTEGA